VGFCWLLTLWLAALGKMNLEANIFAPDSKNETSSGCHRSHILRGVVTKLDTICRSLVNSKECMTVQTVHN